MKLQCEQCGKIFSRPTAKQAESSLRMHVGRMHGNIKVPGQSGKIRTDGDRTPAQIQKLEYQRKWRAAKRRKSRINNGVVGFHFCPVCGMNLEVLATAMHVAKKVTI